MHRTTIGAAPAKDLRGGVAVINFPDFGLSYIDAPEAERRKATVRVGTAFHHCTIRPRESVLADVTAKWRGLDYVIVAGGAREKTLQGSSRYEDLSGRFLDHAKHCGFERVGEVVTAHPVYGWVGGKKEWLLAEFPAFKPSLIHF